MIFFFPNGTRSLILTPRYLNPQDFLSMSKEASPMPALICRLTASSISKLEIPSLIPLRGESFCLNSTMILISAFSVLVLPVKYFYFSWPLQSSVEFHEY